MSIGVKLKNFNNAEIIKIALLKIYLNLNFLRKPIPNSRIKHWFSW